MRTLSRYWRLLWMQVRSSTLLSLQYRADFVIDGAISLFWSATALVPLFVIFQERRSVAGWTFGESLLVVGWFILLQGVLEGTINPSLQTVVEHIRKGTLDFVLLKPADAQFLVSTSKFNVFRIFSFAAAGVIFAYAFRLIGRAPSAGGVLTALLLMGSATLLLYSLWILTASAAFYVVKVDNLTYLFSAIFDAARWPVQVFKGALRLVFTFVVPLALMTTFPAQALLDRLDGTALGVSLAVPAGFAALARWVWLRSLAKYTSASS